MSLARELLKLKSDETLRSTTATVTNDTPFTVTLADGVEITDPPRAGTYTPAVDDVVFVLRPGDGFLVLCNIV